MNPGWMRSLAALSLAGLVAGCAAVATSVVLSSGPEILASAMRQYNFRSEFDEAVPLVKTRNWKALATLARAKLVREPTRGEWWHLAGYGHLQAGELVAARECFARATQLLPEEVGGWNLYAATLARLGDTRGAALALERALQTDPTSTLAWIMTGDQFAADGREREALRAYDRALEIDRRDIFAWYALGLLAKRMNDGPATERAVAALKQLYPPFADELAGKPANKP